LKNDAEYKNSFKNGKILNYKENAVKDIITHEILGVAINCASDLYRIQNDFPILVDLI